MTRSGPGRVSSPPRLSAVIPTLDEEDSIEATLVAARGALGPEAELLVVDGGSRDRTRERAVPHATVLVAQRGRGLQMNVGARAADGSVLVFLHADTRLEPGAGTEILRCLADPGVVGGCCRFAVEPPARFPGPFALLELGVNLRTRLFRTATGDQAIFVRRDAFRRVGGFPDVPLFEDISLVRRLKGLGRFRPTDIVARTSRRRWERNGFLRTVALHWTLRVGYWLRVPPERLAAWYARAA